MEKPTPSLRQLIIEAWLDGMGTYQELAEHFNVSPAYVKHVLRPFQRPERSRRLSPINTDTLELARGIYNVLPMEVADPFTYRFEEQTGLQVGMLFTPNM